MWIYVVIVQKIEKKRIYVANNREAVNKRRRDYWKDNPEKYKRYLEKGILYRQNNRDKELQRHILYRQNNKDKELQRGKRHRDSMSDSYIKNLIVAYNTSLETKDIPQEVVEAKREHLKLKRLLKRTD